MRFADPCEADPYLDHLVEAADGSVTGTTPCGIYTTAHIRLHRDDLKRWRRLRAQALTDLPVLTALAGYLEQLRAVARESEREELASRIIALRRYIEESRRRFRIS
jgi:hypothetical protein